MKIKQIIVGVIASILAIGSIGPLDVQAARAGQDDFIMPYYNGYVEIGATIISQDTVIDMSEYNGVGAVGFDSGVVTAMSEYQISVTEENAVFYLPYAWRLDDLNNIDVKVNGYTVTPERVYGDMPYYYAGLGGDNVTILDAIASVKPSTLEKMGKLYIFETSEEPLEYSFYKTENQTVIHNGMNWSSYGADGYSIRYNTNTNEEYPYTLFVSEGELQNFTASVNYSVEDITHKEYLDYYVDELIAEIGEEYREILYSNFNRQLDGQVKDVYDVVYHYSDYVFALLKITMPIGDVVLTVNTKVKPMVNGLYKPYIYTVRTVSAYPQICKYSLSVIPSEELPYLVEQNIGLNEFLYTSNKQISDGYYIVCAEDNPNYALNNNAPQKDKTWVLYLGLGVGGIILLGVGAYLLVSWRKCR